MMFPTMDLRQRNVPFQIIEKSLLKGVPVVRNLETCILEQKWVDPARPHAYVWKAIPKVDQDGNPFDQGEEKNEREQSDQCTGEGTST